MRSVPWRVEVMGRSRLCGADQDAQPLERKLAATLTYLALEGPTFRARLVGLLWPDSPEATARNNLSQMLRRLRLMTGQDLLLGVEALELAPGVEVDAAALRDLAAQGRHAELLTQDGELLAGHAYDDCPDFADWLTAEREQLLEWRLGALRAELTRLERGGDYSAALAHARAMLNLDPVSEEAFRHVMRLHYLNGDRPAALKAYQRCQTVLRREFGVEPLPETARLAREIDGGTVPAAPPSRAAPLPLVVQRPPHLVGREREWAQMQAAWAAGQGILLGGPPGVGKTRLAQDFLASLGPYARIDARPGDANVPYSTFTRSYRERLAAGPLPDLPAWVRAELARLLPEFGPPPPPILGEEQKLRFFSAVGTLVAAAGHLAVGELYDDVQYIDAASAELVVFLGTSPSATGAAPHPPILTYRLGEVPPHLAPMLEALVDSGQAVRIELAPLADRSVDALLTDLGVEGDPTVRARLREHSGGNPLFLLETVKHLIETGQLGRALPEHLPLPPRVGQLIERRLALLSATALQAARAAAVLQRDFGVELVAGVLGAPLFDLLPAWEELEAAQIVLGERFSHDLVYEAVRQGLPASVRPLLHRGAARALEREGAHPARIAAHWQEGGKPALAAPLWLAAAELARSRYLIGDSAALLHRAAEAYRQADEPDAAFEALSACTETLGHLEDRSRREAALRELFAAARTPGQEARAWHLQAELHLAHHEGTATGDAARAGLTCLEREPLSTGAVRAQRAGLEAMVGAALWLQGRMPEAAATLRRVVETQEALGPSPDLASNLSNLAVILDHLEHHREATPYHLRACELLERAGHWPDLDAALGNLAVNLLDQGQARRALAAAERALDLAARSDVDHSGALIRHGNIGQVYVALSRYDLALDHFERAGAAALEGTWHGAFVLTLRAEVLLMLGDLDGAARALEGSLARPDVPASYRVRTLTARADLAARRGEDARGWLDEAEALLTEGSRPFARLRVWLSRTHTVSAEAALALAREAGTLAHTCDLGGAEIAAHVRAAQALLALGRGEDAAGYARQAGELLDTLDPALVTRGEALRTLASALDAVGDPGAEPAAARAKAWLDEVRARHVPPEHLTRFLAQARRPALFSRSGAETPER